MTLNEKKTQIIQYCRKLYDKGYLPGLDGNISMRADENSILITPSGMGKDIVTEYDLVLVGLDGETLSSNDNPSIETPMHIAAYKQSKEINAVIHMHSPYATTFALARHTIDTRYAPFAHVHLGEIGYVSYNAPGSEVFHEEVTGFFKNGHKVMLLESHGSIVLAENMESAYAKADLLENYAMMLLSAKALGGAKMLSEEELKNIYAG